MSKRIRNGLLYLLLLGIALVAMYQVVPPRPTGMDAEFPIWYHLRVALFSLAASMLVFGFVAILVNLRKILSLVPALLQFRHLLVLLVKKNLTRRYRGSILGVLWSFLDPLFNMIIMTIVFSTILARTVPYFAAYLFTGSMIFTCFSETVSGGMQSIVGNAKMINKVYVPKYIFPLSKAIVAVINVFLSMLPLLLIMLVIGAPIRWTFLLSPIAILYLSVFSFGLSLVMATLYVFFRDIKHMWMVARTGLRYMSAIFFDIASIPVAYLPLFSLNPVYHYIKFFRAFTFYGTLPTLGDHLLCGGMAVVSLCLGLFVFYRNQDKFVLHM